MTSNKAETSLEDRIRRAGDALTMLRTSPIGPFMFPGIPGEFTNWRDEQRAWKDGVALLELSYHMNETHVRGPDAVKFLAELATNRFDPFSPMRGKQIVFAAADGHMISDAILTYEEEGFLRVVGPPTASHWVRFNAQNTHHDVKVVADDAMIVPRERRDVFRVQVQGPHAVDLMREVAGNTLPDIKFFHIGSFQIAGKPVRALRHGMAGRL